MGYSVNIYNKKTCEVLKMRTPDFFRGSNVPAEVDPATGRLVPAKQTEASISITYNYSTYYYEATSGDSRFFGVYPYGDSCVEQSIGLRALNHKTPEEAIPMLTDMIGRIRTLYTDENGDWITSKRERCVYCDASGKEIEDYIQHIIMHDDAIKERRVKEYEVYEGDESDYWERTAANAIRALRELLRMCVECVGMEGVIEID